MRAFYVIVAGILLAGIGSSIGVPLPVVGVVFLLGMGRKTRIGATTILHLVETWLA